MSKPETIVLPVPDLVVRCHESPWETAAEIERLREVKETAREFVRFVENNLPHLKPHEVHLLFGHLEWDELCAALKEHPHA